MPITRRSHARSVERLWQCQRWIIHETQLIHNWNCASSLWTTRAHGSDVVPQVKMPNQHIYKQIGNHHLFLHCARTSGQLHRYVIRDERQYNCPSWSNDHTEVQTVGTAITVYSQEIMGQCMKWVEMSTHHLPRSDHGLISESNPHLNVVQNASRIKQARHHRIIQQT